MENNEHPTWLVPIDIAEELKEIGFNEPCNHYVRISNDDIKLKINHSSIGLVILKRNSEYLNDDIASLGQMYLLGSELVAYITLFAIF